ncbi:hypothetical protein NTHI1209_01068 [Haemophilus influenzae]|uniref:Uncharacterized protein n=1 Tax=Haemophilus influenzae TaxID=727 RepID=A0A158SX67_HAEIF|nr:hypothetical protein NTHI1209_01068 [Haemophilus influenzae]
MRLVFRVILVGNYSEIHPRKKSLRKNKAFPKKGFDELNIKIVGIFYRTFGLCIIRC